MTDNDDPNVLPPVTLDELEEEIENARDHAHVAAADAFVSRFICENLLLELHRNNVINGVRFISSLRDTCHQLDPRSMNPLHRQLLLNVLDDIEALLVLPAARPGASH